MKQAFIIAFPRSGTSWLQGMLGNLPEIATVRETHLADTYLRQLVNSWHLEHQQTAPDGLKAILTEAEFYECLKAFCDRVFNKFLEFNADAEIILEKTPDHLDFVDLLNNLYPEAYFIHVIRDPRAVVASHLALKQEEWSWVRAEETHTDLAWRWNQGMEKRDRAAELLKDRFLEVRYEDMKHNQNSLLLDVTKFLGLHYTQEQLDLLIPQVSARDLDRTKADFPTHSPFYDTRPNFFRRGEIDSWKQELTEIQINEIEAVCMDAMKAHQYQPYN